MAWGTDVCVRFDGEGAEDTYAAGYVVQDDGSDAVVVHFKDGDEFMVSADWCEPYNSEFYDVWPECGLVRNNYMA